MCGQHDSRSGRAAAAAATAAAAACQPVDCVAHSLVAVHCCRQGQDATALRDLQHWAEAERCAEAQRLLAKAHLQVAMNRMLRSGSTCPHWLGLLGGPQDGSRHLWPCFCDVASP